MPQKRIRDIGISIGRFPAGALNAITDVDGVWVGQQTLHYDEPRLARTGLTMILPRGAESWSDVCFAGFHAFNGTGEMTGIHWLEESGLLCSPIAITNTHQVGLVRDTLIAYAKEQGHTEDSALPVVAETYDGWLSDIDAFHLQAHHVYQALAEAGPGPVAEGNVGGGTGTICHEFKGGIGTSSRLVETASGQFTVGTLVQANHGDRHRFQVDGVAVGRLISTAEMPSGWDEARPSGSLIAILATDAPLLPGQCKRLARRATIGMARAGGIGHNGSGDLFLAFSTGNHVPAKLGGPLEVTMAPHHHLSPLFEAAADSVEEAILNCLTAAETTTGIRGRVAHALPLDQLAQIMASYGQGRGGG
jgi:D-aminopeptidase